MELDLESGIKDTSISEVAEVNLNNLTTKKIKFTPELTDGDKVILKWKNGFEIVITKEDGTLKSSIVTKGAYNEMEYLFGDTPGEYDYIDTKAFKEI